MPSSPYTILKEPTVGGEGSWGPDHVFNESQHSNPSYYFKIYDGGKQIRVKRRSHKHTAT